MGEIGDSIRRRKHESSGVWDLNLSLPLDKGTRPDPLTYQFNNGFPVAIR
jgi:hypothetical protein